jgi:Domain of unknown function (DUF4123)
MAKLEARLAKPNALSDEVRTDRLLQLFTAELKTHRLYAIIDAAVDTDLVDWLYATNDLTFDCALPGTINPDEFYVAPFFVDLSTNIAALRSVLEKWTLSSACFMLAKLSENPDLQFDICLRQVRQFAIARDSNGKPIQIRYWDPRVLPVLHKHLSAEQWSQWFDEAEIFRALLFPSVLGHHVQRLQMQGNAIQLSSTPLQSLVSL